MKTTLELQCPYYKSKHKETLICEYQSLNDGAYQDVERSYYYDFDSLEERKDHHEKFCCGEWRKCPHARELNRFYNYL